jgi:hypothetical protein
MIEYLHDAIRATAGNNIAVTAVITDDNDEAITENCFLMLHDKDRKTIITEIRGNYENDEWTFIIPADKTKGLKGRYWYCIRHVNNSLCFKQPIYLV